LNHHIIDVISTWENFRISAKPYILNEYKFQQIIVEYPVHYGEIEVLRPHIQLKLVESMVPVRNGYSATK